MLRNTEHLKVFKEKYYIQEERKPITKKWAKLEHPKLEPKFKCITFHKYFHSGLRVIVSYNQKPSILFSQHSLIKC